MALSIFTAPYSNDSSYRTNLLNENLDLQKAICSDGFVGRYSKINDVGLFLQNEMRMMHTQAQKETNKYVGVRANFVEAQVEELLEVTSRLHVLAVRARSWVHVGDGSIFNLPDTVDGMLKQVNEILNRRMAPGGEVSLAGINSQDDAVLNLSSLSSLDADAGEDFGYYKGGLPKRQLITVDGQDTVNIIPVTACDPGIESLIRALRIAKAGDPSIEGDPHLINAINLAEQATKQLSTSLAKIAFIDNKVLDLDKELDKRLEDINEGIKSSILMDGTEAFLEDMRNQESLKISRTLDIQRMTNFSYLLGQLERVL
jgi:uncharacterized protein YaiE (UPF0345 family)